MQRLLAFTYINSVSIYLAKDIQYTYKAINEHLSYKYNTSL